MVPPEQETDYWERPNRQADREAFAGLLENVDKYVFAPVLNKLDKHVLAYVRSAKTAALGFVELSNELKPSLLKQSDRPSYITNFFILTQRY